MSVFSKILENLGKTITKELDKSASKNASKEASKNLAKPSVNPHEQKQIHKEQRGIYNVTYNGKNTTAIHKDLEKIDEVIAYSKGNRNKGARHIHLEHSLDSNQQGYVTPDEVANLGQNLRNYLAKHKKPFIDKNGSRIYEWENEAGVRFRAVVGNTNKAGKDPATKAESKDLSLPTQRIITFYSDRNAKNKMDFKNPKLQESSPIKSNKQDSSTLIDRELLPMERE